ncbi:cysteine desulfurase family protein [Petrotoga sp. 9PWA.NaAc.5.4]|uniref:cysteine desulfurase family protein n=1 Tax=Petrotoga sp. 9PWA.NaAc.5.4 TaxID=1434328 RepID=UPI000CA7B54C|nr:cysteine desulfurase family protein [Petrotoga sp. 9PWA.NaAc.5.4]PNR92481.1 cysteine desulfurase [Petrotoga sp. 9PWA.NaAc.5.4]
MIYFDNNATTKVDEEVAEVILKYMTKYYANPNSIHKFGVEVENDLEEARENIAKLLKVSVNEIYFTSCATESINWVLRGVAKANSNRGKHIITSSIEHSAVISTLKDLERLGYEVTYLKVDKKGIVELEELSKSIRKDTILVSLMAANNEIGTIEPIKEAYKIVKEKNKEAYFHIDAVQALGKIPFDLEIYKCEFASFSAHKFHGPKGVGILYKKTGSRIFPLITGGNQENAMRGGTQNVAGIIGTSIALKKSCEHIPFMNSEIKEIRNMLANELKSMGAEIVTPLEDSVPNTLAVFFPKIRGDIIVNALSEEEIFVSTTSACSSKVNSTSKVMREMGYDEDSSKGMIRISLSYLNNHEEVQIFVNKLKNVLKFLNY